MAGVPHDSFPIPLTDHHRPTVEFLPSQIDGPLDLDGDDDSDADIYRGEPPSPPRTPRPESVSSSSSSSSSSSGSFVFGGRLGAISQLVEHAISHWTRAWASTSSLNSSSSSSSSSTNSIMTRTRSMASKRRSRRSSVADLHNARSEREVAARIRAREQARQIPREFALYSPPGEGPPRFRPSAAGLPLGSDERDGVLRTDSLELIVSRLSVALKDNLKSRRAREVAHITRVTSEPGSVVQSTESTPVLHNIPHISVDAVATSTPQLPSTSDHIRRKAKKGKNRAGKAGLSIPKILSERDMDRAWWLDVSSPTTQDMRAIANVCACSLESVNSLLIIFSSYYRFIR